MQKANIKNVDVFRGLLSKFDTIPKLEQREPTFMEIAGYPHYENVCSNILAFFFDSNENHNLKELFVESILECLKCDYNEIDYRVISVRREELTTKGNRIDLVIECEDIIIVIENKIWAKLHNELSDYKLFIHKKYKNKTKRFVVLSLNKTMSKAEEKERGFVNITHESFIEVIQQKIGSRLIHANNKYIPFLLDFLETTLNHTKPEIMNEEMQKFFIEEKENIENLFKEKEKIDKVINRIAKSVRNQLEDVRGYPNIKQSIWRGFVLYHNVSIGDVIVSVDCVFRLEGIAIRIWLRKGKANNEEFLRSLEIFEEYSTFEKGRGIIVQKHEDMPLNTDKDKLAEKLRGIISKIKVKKQSS